MIEISTAVVVALMSAVLVGGVGIGWFLGRRRGVGESFAKSQIPNAPLADGPIDLLAAISDAVDMVKDRAAAKAITLKLSLPEALPVLRADETMVNQMLNALLANALETTPTEGWVVITAGRGRRGLSIAVADTGSGVSVEQVTKIKTWIEQHGGEFQCNTLEGRGTTVALTFPPWRLDTGEDGQAPGVS